MISGPGEPAAIYCRIRSVNATAPGSSALVTSSRTETAVAKRRKPSASSPHSPVTEVIRIDVGHHGHLARVLQEGAIALIRLDDHDVAAAEMPARGRAGERTTDHEGSNPQPLSTCAIIAVVVVLPCVPATVPRRPSISTPSAALRWSTRRPRRRASASSGLSSRWPRTPPPWSSPSCSARCPT